MFKKLLACLVSVIFLCAIFFKFQDMLRTEVLGPVLEYFTLNLNFLAKKNYYNMGNIILVLKAVWYTE